MNHMRSGAQPLSCCQVRNLPKIVYRSELPPAHRSPACRTDVRWESQRHDARNHICATSNIGCHYFYLLLFGWLWCCLMRHQNAKNLAWLSTAVQMCDYSFYWESGWKKKKYPANNKESLLFSADHLFCQGWRSKHFHESFSSLPIFTSDILN